VRRFWRWYTRGTVPADRIVHVFLLAVAATIIVVLANAVVDSIADEAACEHELGGDWTSLGCIVGDYEVVEP